MASVTFGPFQFNLTSRELQRSGVLVKLQPQPSKLLVLLVERAGEVITRNEIRRSVWGTDTFVDFDQSVNFCVRQIRAALHDTADRPCYVETLPRHGYRFIAPVQRIADRADQSDGAPASPGVIAPSRRFRRLHLAVGSFVLLIAATQTGRGSFGHVGLPASTDANRKLHHEIELGRFFLNKWSRPDTLAAIEHFEAALEEDPDCAPAYAGLAEAYNQLGGVFIAGKPPANVRLLALRAATRAIQLDPKLAPAYAALGYTTLHELDWSQARRALERAIELGPRYARAHQTYATYLAAQRRFAEAIEAARRGLDLEPASLRARQLYGWMLYFDRQYDAAIRELRIALEMDATYALAQFHLGEALLVSGRFEEAIATLQANAERTGRAPAVVGLLAMAYGGRGEHAQAQRIVEELEQRASMQTVPTGALLLAYLGADDKARAIDMLERGYTERDNYEIWIDADPLMDPLRKEPRYQAVCRQVMLGTQVEAASAPSPSLSLSRR
jgi:DNA-binding winged helix-turn-helix (wHTH) protein/Tfp pilus assembly protein PilF